MSQLPYQPWHLGGPVVFPPQPEMTDGQKRERALQMAGNDVAKAQLIYDFLWPVPKPVEAEAWEPEVKTTPWYITQAGDSEFGSSYVSKEAAVKVAESLSRLGKVVKLFAVKCDAPVIYYPPVTSAPTTSAPEVDVNGGQG